MSFDALIDKYATAHGLDPATLRTFVQIESGGNPRASTGSHHGLLQLSDSVFAEHGGGDIYNPEDNLRAGTVRLAGEVRDFKAKYGRPPSATDLYLMHQQGRGGYIAHSGNPDGLAWENMYSTREGRQKGPEWARAAIWGNIPANDRARFGSVDTITSRQFMDLWNARVQRLGGAVSAGGGNSGGPAENIRPSMRPSGLLSDLLGSTGTIGEQPQPAMAQPQTASSDDTPADTASAANTSLAALKGMEALNTQALQALRQRLRSNGRAVRLADVTQRRTAI